MPLACRTPRHVCRVGSRVLRLSWRRQLGGFPEDSGQRLQVEFGSAAQAIQLQRVLS